MSDLRWQARQLEVIQLLSEPDLGYKLVASEGLQRDRIVIYIEGKYESPTVVLTLEQAEELLEFLKKRIEK